MRRTCVGLLACVVVAGGGMHPAVSRAADAAAYWGVADAQVARVAGAWDPATGVYRQAGFASTRLNAALLLVHAIAAEQSHVGQSRQDARAVALVEALTAGSSFRPPGRAPQAHAPGWYPGMDGPGRQHVALDARVAEALAAAFAASATLGLDRPTQSRIRSRVCAVARSPFFSRPRLNQVNWQADVYAACDAVGGGSDLLRGPYRRWLMWFLRHAEQRVGGPGTTTNLNRGLGLNYLPAKASADANRRPSSEYASMLLTMLGPYDRALAAGMRPLPARLERLAKRWQERVLYGDWTDAGYVNWDSGLGFHRWHLRRYWAFAAEGLLTIAQARRLRASPTAVARARATLDAAFALNARLLTDPASASDVSALFGIRSLEPDAVHDAALVAARFGALAARASRLEEVSTPVATPVRAVAYGYDPNVDRLAVSSGSYSAAIVAPTTVGNGGASLSRFSDAAGLPLSGTGGDGATATAFGLRVVRGASVGLETQPGRAHPRQRVRLAVEAPAGGGVRRSVRTVAVVDRPAARAVVTHVFEPDRVRVTYRLVRRWRARAQVRFPAYGDATFLVTRGGVDEALGTTAVPVGDLRVVLADGRGYRVQFSRVFSGATLRLVAAGVAASAPRTRLTAFLEVPVARGATTISYDLLPSAR